MKKSYFIALFYLFSISCKKDSRSLQDYNSSIHPQITFTYENITYWIVDNVSAIPTTDINNRLVSVTIQGERLGYGQIFQAVIPTHSIDSGASFYLDYDSEFYFTNCHVNGHPFYADNIAWLSGPDTTLKGMNVVITKNNAGVISGYFTGTYYDQYTGIVSTIDYGEFADIQLSPF